MSSQKKDVELLRPLVDKILEASSDPKQGRKKRLWAEHQALHKIEKILVTVYYEGIPRPQWTFMFGENYLKTESALARYVEFNLRRRLWMADNVPDDHIIWPSIVIPAVISQPLDWGVPLSRVGSDEDIDNPLEARKIVPPFTSEIEINRLQFTDLLIDKASTSLAIEEANELLEGRLDVYLHYPNLGYSPFDIAVGMRGIQNIMYDVIDCPEKVHLLMNFITNVFELHHRRREEQGWVNYIPTADGKYTEVGFRVHCAFLSPNFDPEIPRLHDEWAYISAQTSSGLSPHMFDEFVHPYNMRLAKFFTNQTVYYHGCECLDQKIDIIATLPNLRRFHVSPWSSVETAKEKFQGKVILEVHAHPGKVFFGFSREDMHSDIKRLIDAAEGVPIDLNLSDIHSFNGNPKLLTTWAEEIQKVSAGKS